MWEVHRQHGEPRDYLIIKEGSAFPPNLVRAEWGFVDHHQSIPRDQIEELGRIGYVIVRRYPG